MTCYEIHDISLDLVFVLLETLDIDSFACESVSSKTSLNLHVKDPMVLVQVVWPSQLCVPLSHSFIYNHLKNTFTNGLHMCSNSMQVIF